MSIDTNININRIHGTSLVTTSINVPLEFGLTDMDSTSFTLTYDDNYKFVVDENNITSIIELDIVPFIDYSKYDNDRRKWFNIDKYGSLWRHYKCGDFIIEKDKLFTSGGDPNGGMCSAYGGNLYYSMENLFKLQYDYLYPNDEDRIKLLNDLQITEYEPISLLLKNEKIKDVTDYTFNITPTLDYIVPEKNKQFYFKNNRLYTNLDLTLYEPQDIVIKYKSTINKIKVKNIMDTNSNNYSNYTPIVDYYMLKITGQNL